MEDFEDGNVDDWSPAGPNGVIEPVAGPVAPNGGDYVGKVNFAGSRYGPNRLLEPSNPDYFSWLFLADADSWHGGGVGFYVSIESGWMAHISYHQGNLMYRPAHGWAYTPFMPATEGTWYLIELRNIDWSADTYDLWVDGGRESRGSAVPGCERRHRGESFLGICVRIDRRHLRR